MFSTVSAGPQPDPDIPGAPIVETDSDGKVVYYENTEELSFESGEQKNVDTGFLPFDGHDWTLHLYAHFAWEEQNWNWFATILNALPMNTYPWNGFSINYQGPQLLFTKQLYNDMVDMSTDSNGDIDVYITYISGVITVVNNSEEVCSYTPSYDVSTMTISLGSMVAEDGSKDRYAVCDIYEFYIRRLN